MKFFTGLFYGLLFGILVNLTLIWPLTSLTVHLTAKDIWLILLLVDILITYIVARRRVYWGRFKIIGLVIGSIIAIPISFAIAVSIAIGRIRI